MARREARRLVMHRRRLQGVALISVLLVVAVATVLSVSMVSTQNLNLHRVTNQLDQEQAYQYALGGEELARQILHQDFVDGNQSDNLAEDWAAPFEPFSFDQGEVTIQITDLQGLFNLNSLAATGTQGAAQAFRFRALLEELGIDPTFADRVADWVDEDQVTRSAGAEDYDYLDDDPPHRTPGHGMGDTSELRMILDLDEESYANLLSYVTALPDSSASLNVNTAPPVILQTIARDLSLDQAQLLAEQRDANGGFNNVAEFLQQPGVTGQAGILASGLSVTSEYFRVDVRATYNARVSTLVSMIQRSAADGSLRVLSRDLGRGFVPRKTSDANTQGQ